MGVLWVHAQSNLRLEGRIFRADLQEPLSGAIVEVENTTYSARSDETGYFALENIPPGIYRIIVRAPGYQSRDFPMVRIREDQPTRLVVALQPIVYSADTVVVSAPAVELYRTGSVRVITREQIRQLAPLGMRAVLQSIAGVRIESVSGEGSETRIRLHGSRSSQVLVLLDGQRLNNPQTGEVDLSRIPLNQVERIEVELQGDAARYGANAFDGVIHFHTQSCASQQQDVQLTGKAGSFGFAAGEFSLRRRYAAWQFLGSFRQNYSRQNFPYRYKGEDWIRENAYFRNRNFFGKLLHRAGKFHSRLSFSAGNSVRGLPSPYFNEYRNYGAHLNQFQWNVHFHQQLVVHSRLVAEWEFGWVNLTQEYHNEADPIVFTRYASRQTDRTFQASARISWQIASRWLWKTEGEYFQEYLFQEDRLYPERSMGVHRRTSAGMFTTLEWELVPVKYLWQSLRIQPGIRFMQYFGEKALGYPSLRIALIPSGCQNLSVFFSLARSVRYPDFNSLFWVGDARSSGNPELSPERKKSLGAGISFQKNGVFYPNLYLYAYREEITDLIYWLRGLNGVWRPENLYRAEKKGVDISLQQTLWPGWLTLSLNYSSIRATNRTPDPLLYGKQLVFVPPYTWNGTMVLHHQGWKIMFFYQNVSQRETVPANSRGTSLPPYQVWDVAFSQEFQLNEFQFTAMLAIKNLGNQDYQLIFGYPMPGRHFQMSLKIVRKLSR